MGIDRIFAALLALLCIAGLVYLNKHTLFPGEEQARAGTNPQFVKCRDERILALKKMRDEGVIDEVKFTEFSKRETTLCNAQFPSGGS